MTVVGYLITRAFVITLGGLADCVADLEYSVAGQAWRFSLATQTAPPGARATLILNPHGLYDRWPVEEVPPGESPAPPVVTVRALARAEEEPWPQVRLIETGVVVEGVPLDAEVMVTPR